MEKKKTIVEMYEQIKAHLTDPAEIEFIEKRIEITQKKNAKTGEPTKAQKANLALAEQMLEWMEEDTPYTISELSKNCPAVLGATPQKIRPLLTGLISAKAVIRTEEKGKPMFTKIAVED